MAGIIKNMKHFIGSFRFAAVILLLYLSLILCSVFTSDDVLRSPLFFTVNLLAVLNLLTCTLFALVKSLKRKRIPSPAQIIHVGMIMILTGLMISFVTRKSGTLTLYPGETGKIDKQTSMVFIRYEKSNDTLRFIIDGKNGNSDSIREASPKETIREGFWRITMPEMKTEPFTFRVIGAGGYKVIVTGFLLTALGLAVYGFTCSYRLMKGSSK